MILGAARTNSLNVSSFVFIFTVTFYSWQVILTSLVAKKHFFLKDICFIFNEPI